MPIPIPLPTRVRPKRWSLLALFGLSLALACGSDHLTPPGLTDPAVLFWDLRLTQRAVTLSTTPPYDTLTLTVIPRNYAGDALTEAPLPRYTTSDDSRVVVTPEGVLVAVSPTPFDRAVTVVATLTIGGVTHRDSVFVKVVANPTPPVLASLSIQPVPPDTAKRSYLPLLGIPALQTDASGSSLLPPVRATDMAGQPLSDFLVAYSVSDTTVVGLFTPYYPYFNDYVADGRQAVFEGLRTGQVTFYASATVFGVTKVDTLPYRIGWPVARDIWLSPDPSRGPGNFFRNFYDISNDFFGDSGKPSEITMGAGGVVGWYTSNRPLDAPPTPFETDIVFDDPTNVHGIDVSAQILKPSFYPGVCSPPGRFRMVLIDGCSTGGNFVLPADSIVAAYRAFPVPGIYEYRNAQNGARGRIIVLDER